MPYIDGEKTVGKCDSCKRQVGVTIRTRDYVLEEPAIILVKNILVGVCDSCNRTIDVPEQSIPAIQAAVQQYYRIKENQNGHRDQDV